MAQIINTNIPSLNAQRNLSTTQETLSRSLQRLSSGLRVNSARDDAAGLAIAERMGAQARGMNVAIHNANDGISLAQTAEAALGTITSMLQRMRELAVQSANASNGPGDRNNLDQEYQQLSQEITRTLAGTRFNGLNILASAAASLTFQVGPGTSINDQVTVVTADLATNPQMSVVTGGNITTAATALTAMDNVDTALDLVNSERATWGATQNRFDAVIANLQVGAENQTAARSRIMDADFAAETAALTRAQILQQAGTAMLAQSNQLPNNVLQLLK